MKPHNNQIISLPKDIQLPEVPKSNKNIFIAHQTEKKIADFDTLEEDQLILKQLMVWKVMTGITNQPAPEDFVLILDFIKINYGTLNIFDIKNAMNLSSSNQLEIKKTANDESFANFSCVYVGRILSAYIEYKKEIVFDVRKAIEKKQSLLPPPKKSLAEQKKDLFTYIEKSYNEIVLQKHDYEDYLNLFFTFLYRNNFIQITEAKRNEAILYARTKLTSKIVPDKPKSSLAAAIDNFKKINEKLEEKSNKPSNKNTSSYTEEDVNKAAANYTLVKYILKLKSINDLLDKITEEHIDNWYNKTK